MYSILSEIRESTENFSGAAEQIKSQLGNQQWYLIVLGLV